MINSYLLQMLIRSIMNWINKWQFERNVALLYELIVKYAIEIQTLVAILFYFNLNFCVSRNQIECHSKNKWRTRDEQSLLNLFFLLEDKKIIDTTRMNRERRNVSIVILRECGQDRFWNGPFYPPWVQHSAILGALLYLKLCQILGSW